MYADNYVILSSVTHPKFKLSWFTDTEEKKKAKRLLMEAFNRESREESTSANSYILFLICRQTISTINTFRSAINDNDDVNDPSPTKKRKKDFYAPLLQTEIEHISEVEQFLKHELGLLNQLNSFPTLKKMFKCANFSNIYGWNALKMIFCSGTITPACLPPRQLRDCFRKQASCSHRKGTG